MMSPPQCIYRCEGVECDVSNVRLTVNGEIRQLEPKSFRLLQFLMENRARVVPKEELLAAIWADTFVTDNALTRAVTQIRKALADDPRNPEFIETVPTVGYRFLKDVETVTPEIAPSAELPQRAPASETARRKKLLWALVAGAAILALAAGVIALRRAPLPEGSHTLESTQTTTSTGLDICAAFSPDGNLMAYSSDRSGRFQIYVRSLEPGAKELVLTANAGQNLYPSFSPDGRAVAFSALHQAGIFRVPALGGVVQRLTSFGSQPVWSPDGKLIVFRSESAPSLSTTDHYYAATSTLWLIRADGSELRQITTPSRPSGGQAFPTWSADSREIRFANYHDGECEMWTYRLGSGQLRKLFRSAERTGFGSAVFRRDDHAMFYVSSRLNGDIGIWEQVLDPKTLMPQGQPKSIFQPSVGVPRDLALSADGERLAYSAILSDSRLLMIRLRGGSPEPSEPELLTHEANFRYLHPAWSPDGKQLAFDAFQKSRVGRLFLLPYPDGQPAEIDASADPEYYPMFDSAGSRMYYLLLSGQQFTVKRLDLNNGLSKLVAQLPDGVRQPSLRPNASEISFNWKTGDFSHIWKMNLQSGEKRQLTFGEHETGYARFSHDGRWLCYESMQGGQADLGIMPSDGPEPKEVFARGTFYVHDWSPDDSKVLYAGFEDGMWNLYWMDRNTREKRQLTKNTNARVYLRYPSWSWDGGRIAYEFNESKGNVYVARFR